MKKKILTILLAIALTGNMLAADTVVYAAGENTSEDYLEKENDVLEIMDDQVSEEKIVEEQVSPESIQEVSENTLAETATEPGEQEKEDNAEEKIEVDKDTDADAEILYSGKDGDLNWSIDSNGLLTISGVGDWGSEDGVMPKWSNYNDKIISASVNVKDITNTSSMFGDCDKLEEIDLSDMDMSNVTDTEDMFRDCASLKIVDMSEKNLSHVTTMAGMFLRCESLTYVNLSNTNTTVLQDMSNMFNGCTLLEEVKIDGFDTSNVDSMYALFSDCSTLKTLDLSSFKFNSELFSTNEMLWNCLNLSTIILPDSIQQLGENIIEFPFCKSVVWRDKDNNICVNISKNNVEGGKYTRSIEPDTEVTMVNAKCGDLYYTLTNQGKLTISGKGDFEETSFTYEDSIRYAPSWCEYGEWIENAVVDVQNITSTENMFYCCNNLKRIDLENLDTKSVTRMGTMFGNCSSLLELDLSHLETSQVTNMSFMFKGCESLSELDLSHMNTEKVTDMEYMFLRCNKISKLDLSGFNTKQVAYMNGMFEQCGNLTEIVFGNFSTDSVINMSRMFAFCSGLKDLNLNCFNTEKTTYMGYMFLACDSLETLNVQSFDTEKVIDMESMFDNCCSLKTLDISNFNTDSIKNTDREMMTLFKQSDLECIKIPANFRATLYFPATISMDGKIIVDYRYAWKDENEKYCYMATKDLSTPMTYTRCDLPVRSDSSPSPAPTTPPSVKPAPSLAPTSPIPSQKPDEAGNAHMQPVGTTITLSGNVGKFKVTSIDSMDPTVEYTGLTAAGKKKKFVVIPEYITYSGVKYHVVSIGAKCFKNNKKLTSVKVPASITKIGNSAFEGCRKLKTFTIGKNIKSIGSNAFKNCRNLRTLIIRSSKLKTVGKFALKGIHAKCKIKVPSKKLKSYKQLFKGKGQKASVKITK